MEAAMNGSTCMVRFISVRRSIVLRSMTENKEVALSKDRAPATVRFEEGPEPDSLSIGVEE